MRKVFILSCALALGSLWHVHAQRTLEQACQQLGTSNILGALAANGQDHVTATFQGILLAPPNGGQVIHGDQLRYHVMPAGIGEISISTQPTQLALRTVTIAEDATNWYFFGVATKPFVTAAKTDCIAFNKGATLCKINRPMDIPQQSVYDVIKTMPDLSTTTAIIEAQPELLTFAQNVNNSGTLLAPINAAWDHYFSITNKNLDQWKNSSEALSVMNELIGDYDPRTRQPFNAQNTATNGQEAEAVYMDANDMGAFVFPTSVPDNRNDYVAAILSKDTPAGKSLIWTLDRVPIPVDSPTNQASAASANNGAAASGGAAGAAATTAVVSQFLMAGLVGVAFMAVLL